MYFQIEQISDNEYKWPAKNCLWREQIIKQFVYFMLFLAVTLLVTHYLFWSSSQAVEHDLFKQIKICSIFSTESLIISTEVTQVINYYSLNCTSDEV